MFFVGVSASSVSIQINLPFTAPVAPPAGGLLPGVKTAIEADRGYKHPWQATGAPIVPSPFMGSQEQAIQPSMAPQLEMALELDNRGTIDEMLLLMLAASIL